MPSTRWFRRLRCRFGCLALQPVNAVFGITRRRTALSWPSIQAGGLFSSSHIHGVLSSCLQLGFIYTCSENRPSRRCFMVSPTSTGLSYRVLRLVWSWIAYIYLLGMAITARFYWATEAPPIGELGGGIIQNRRCIRRSVANHVAIQSEEAAYEYEGR